MKKEEPTTPTTPDWEAGWFGGAPPRYNVTADVLLRGIAGIYLVAFAIAFDQGPGLIGPEGILPASRHLDALWNQLGKAALWESPSVFWFGVSTLALELSSMAGVLLASAAVLGRGNSTIFLLLWMLQLSWMHIGQVFWGYGWELLLAEAGFLAIFLAPWKGGENSPYAAPVILLFRWLAFRVMFGAGLIKIRGDECWRAFTCLEFHYETQPNPSPLSAVFHAMPDWVHHGGVAFNHFVELVVPFGVFGPRRLRRSAGVLLVAFQITLILSGNLSFLNWLTLIVCLACFDDGRFQSSRPTATPSRWRIRTVWSLVTLVCFLSLSPIVNLLSDRQQMNASFDPFHLVNTYGAFGSITRQRIEVVIEGSNDGEHWREYEFKCKPGAPQRRPCLITPYHYRLDWQMWFAGLSNYRAQPWLVPLAKRLLSDNRAVRSLIAYDPFGGQPPVYIRASAYEYRLAKPSESVWWHRHRVGDYLPALRLE